MGVYGLWRLLDATGKQVPVETLEGKILAIDVSIWIYQALQGYQDRFGNPKPNAHLIVLFNRICKLLYYKIKPVFVFDGGVPMLKRDTIALRRKQKSMARNKARQMRTELINNLIKHSVVKTALNTKEQGETSSKVTFNLPQSQAAVDMFKLPDLPSVDTEELELSDVCDSDSSIELSPRKQTKWMGNIHSVDVSSAEFKALPADVRYDILTDLKETRKQNSWGRLYEMPEKSDQFSGFQMKRLLKRRLVQKSLETAEKEMGGKALTLEELDKLLTEQGVTTNARDCTYRVATDSTTRLIYISDKNAHTNVNNNNNANSASENDSNEAEKTDEPIAGSSKPVQICEDMNEYEFCDEWDSDIEITAADSPNVMMEMNSEESEMDFHESRPVSNKCIESNVSNPALTYMREYSGLTQNQILTLIEESKQESNKNASKAREIDFLETQNLDSRNNLLNVELSDSMCNGKKEIEKVDFIEIAKSIATPKTELSESNVESNIQSPLAPNVSSNEEMKLIETNRISPTHSNSTFEDNKQFTKLVSAEAAKSIAVPNIKLSESIEESNINSSNVDEIETTERVEISTTDSDSDGFIEIEDMPVTSIDTSVKKSDSQHGIQIAFRSDHKIEDDMFADIFTAPNNQLNTEVPSQNIAVSSALTEKSVKSIQDNRGTIENEIIVGKTINAENIKDKESPDLIKINDVQDENIKVMNEQVANKQMKEIESVETTNFQTDTNTRDYVNVNILIDDSKKTSPLPVNEEELLSLKARLEDEQTDLMLNIGKLERQGTDITDQIRVEAQELLRLFGIPYVVAPMEAEAQCAYLEQIHLTDGTITDDSDIWLFGGQCVYKNFFDNNKKVLEFRSCDIQHHFKLTRQEMIRLALLVGSDYTLGLTGIGPVTALEVLAAFPTEGDDLLHGLSNFSSWMKSGRSAGPGRSSLRNKLQNLQVQKGFPSQAVVQAYLFPKVDESKEGFAWGKPNSTLLSNYAKQKFGWTRTKYNEIMTPILKRLEEKQNQKLIDAYFKVQSIPKSIEMTLSKRVQKAVQRLNNPNAEDPVEVAERTQPEIKKTKKSKGSKETQKKKEAEDECSVTDVVKPKVCNVPATNDKNVVEIIPQREKDKAVALKKKLHAIEVLRKSKQGLYKTKKVKRCVRKVTEKAELSESDSSSS